MKLTSNLIVLIFVLAHAVGCLIFHGTGFGDGIVLTILTISMIYALIRYYKASFDVFLGLAFLSCFAGFYIGTEGALLLERVIPSWGIWINVITTSVTTELIGLIVILLLRKNFHASR